MTITKRIILAITILCTPFLYSQETHKVEKIKIGKYKYETYYKSFNNYEVNEKGFSLFYKKRNTEQSICSCIYYKNDSILSLSHVIVDKEEGLITCMLKTLVKRVDFEADSIKYVKKQNKQGFFEPILTVEYKNGKEKILFKK